MSIAYYYSAPGNYATTQGTVNIPVTGFCYNVARYAVPVPASHALAQGVSDSNSSFYYPRGGVSTEAGLRGVCASTLRSEPTRVSAYVSGEGPANPGW
jgi:hypothetical protein